MINYEERGQVWEKSDINYRVIGLTDGFVPAYEHLFKSCDVNTGCLQCEVSVT